MSESNFSQNLENSTSTSSERRENDDSNDPLNRIKFEDSGDYDPEVPFRVFVRGHVESYDEWILLILEVDPGSDGLVVPNFETFSAKSPEPYTKFRYDAPPDFEEEIMNLWSSLDQSEIKDSKNFNGKLTGLMSKRSTVNTVISPLLEGDVHEFCQELTDFLIDQVYPGSHPKLFARVQPLSQQDASNDDPDEKSGEETGEEGDGDDDALKLLKVSPELDPMQGFALSDLRVGDSFDVRVVGESVRDLSSQYIDGDPQEAEQSKIFNAQLVRVQDVTVEGVKKYIVQLDENIYGKRVLDPDTRIKVRNLRDVSFPARFKYRFFYTLILIMVLLFSLSITFILFPEPILNLINSVTIG